MIHLLRRFFADRLSVGHRPAVKRYLRRGAAVVIAAGVVAGCESPIHYSGYIAPASTATSITVGMPVDDVLKTLGEPTITRSIGGKQWYYISSEVVTAPAKRATVVRQAILRVEFNGSDQVRSVAWLTEKDGVDVTPAEQKTRAIGTNTGFFQQMLSRISAVPAGAAPTQNILGQ